MFAKKKYPYSYRAYGLNILSQLPVTGFEPASFETADVHIHKGPVPENLGNIINQGVLYQSNESEFLLRMENVGAYYVRNGNEIIVQPTNTASTGEVSAFLTGTSFGALMHQKKLLPLHASTVIFKEKCLVIAGISGAGKTTLAAALIKAGGTLVADDVSVIDFSGEKPAVHPAFPTIKIWEDSLKHLDINITDLEPVRGELKKYYLPVNKFNHIYTAISHIYILNTHNRPELEIKSLQGVDKFRILKKHTYFFRGIPKTGLEKNHFILANKLAVKTPITLLTRPNREFNTEKIVKAISENL
ncbi:MAG: hypothetical protein JXR41_06645 [Bacteroidales bacterium]|nr:hypothetical protein [Bacteroidales bacterium]MBN2762749.1 hypothetical protein [Bacteroidales bacterium]